MTSDHPLFRKDNGRFVLFPIRNREIWDMYKKALNSFWVIEEIDLTYDILHWKEKLNENERFFIIRVLAFFAQSDGIVSENLAVRFFSDVNLPEARMFYGFQIAMENIHAEMYSKLIETFVTDTDQRAQVFNAMDTIPSIQRKGLWAKKWIESTTASFGERLVAFATVEGVFFSSSFCSIFWLKNRGLMPGLAASNEFISRDEGLHTDFACLMFWQLPDDMRPSSERVTEIIKEGFECEKEFVNDSLPVNVIGMNSVLMIQYVQFCADRLLQSLGCSKVWNVSNPFPFMDMISLQGKTNFHERRVTEYRKAGGTDTFQLQDDF